MITIAIFIYSILECYQRLQKCPNCKAKHDRRSTQLYHRLYFSNNGENGTDADHALIQSLKAKVDRLESKLKNSTACQTRSDISEQFNRLYSDYEAKDNELVEAVSKLSLVTASNEKLEETLKSSLLKTRNKIAAAKSEKEQFNLRIPLAPGEQNCLVREDGQNMSLSRKERQLAKAEEELNAQRSRIYDLERECKLLACRNRNLEERENLRFPSSSSQRRLDTGHSRIYELQKIAALETELASIKTQRNRHHREATKQRKKVDRLEKQTEEMGQVMVILDALIEKDSLHILNQPSSSRHHAQLYTHSAYQG